MLLGGAVGAIAAPVATGSAVREALADVSLMQNVRHCRCVKWKCRRPHHCWPCKPRKPIC
jgi:hypothetical protein